MIVSDNSAHERPGSSSGSSSGLGGSAEDGRRQSPLPPPLSPNSRGATDSFNDTVGVAACLRLILPTWLKFAVGSFSSVLSRQKGPFRCCLCAGVRACVPCAGFAHVRLQSWRDAREREKKSLSGYYHGCVGILCSRRWWVLFVLVSSVLCLCLLRAIYTHMPAVGCTSRRTLNDLWPVQHQCVSGSVCH